MKTLRSADRLAQRLRTPTLFTIAASLALVFWLSTGSAAVLLCTFCHKRTTTMTLACTDLDYQRHLDHGDTVGACSATRTSTDETKAKAK